MTVIGLDYSFFFKQLYVLFFIAAWQRTIYSFNLEMYFNVCEYLWGFNLSLFLRQIVDSDGSHVTFLIFESMLIAESNYQNNMSN